MTKQEVTRSSSIWMDSPARYGVVSRVLHWGMAYLLVWQFAMILSWRVFDGSDLLKTISSYGPGHGTVGALTIFFVTLRAIWALANRHRRPAHAAGWVGRAARAGHACLYLLMFAIPALALLRTYGNGKGWSLWGMQIVPSTGVRADWLTAPANALHGTLSWLLLCLIAGHVAVALVHHFIGRDDTLARMAGRLIRRPQSDGHPAAAPSKV